MRLSSIVSLVVVTASLALGGCAADAEPGTDGTQPNVALSEKNDDVVAPAERDRLNDLTQVGQIKDLKGEFDFDKASPISVKPEGDPRFQPLPSVLERIPVDKLTAQPPQFAEENDLLVKGAVLEPGFTPYGKKKKD